MKIKYLGTAAAEGIPAAFCHCDNCERFRKLGGKNLRARTQAVIDGKILIDFHGDTFMNFMRFGLDLSGIKHVLFTHSHSDHLDPLLLDERIPVGAKNMTESDVYIYGSKDSLDVYKRLLNNWTDEHIHLIEIKTFVPFEFDGYKVTPLKAKHQTPEQSPFIFLIEKDGKAMIYGNDTDNWFDENVIYLRDNNVKLDFVAFDCTYGEAPANKYGGHMSLYDDAQQFSILKENGIVDDNTKAVVVHFSHNMMLEHDELQALADEFKFSVVFDGAEYEF